jgi:hypothetical protein
MHKHFLTISMVTLTAYFSIILASHCHFHCLYAKFTASIDTSGFWSRVRARALRAPVI